MSNVISKMVKEAANRYLKKNEREQLLEYSNSLPFRLSIAEEIENKEEEIVQYCIGEVKKLHPNLTKHHENVWTKGYRDVQLMLRAAVHAMLLDNLDYLNQKTLIWFKNIMTSLEFSPQVMHDTYTALRRGVANSIEEQAFAIIEPYLTLMVDELSSIPEPKNVQS